MNMSDAMQVYTALLEAMSAIDQLPASRERANVWLKVMSAKNIVLVAIEETGAAIEFKEAA